MAHKILSEALNIDFMQQPFKLCLCRLWPEVGSTWPQPNEPAMKSCLAAHFRSVLPQI